MKIVADRNIIAVEESFRAHGTLNLVDGRSVSRADVRDADVLLVRSITAVDEKLLAGSSVRFVGTATSGIDHIDVDYLQGAGIGFAHAKGSNANAVVEYCFAALAHAVLHRGFIFEGSRFGIVGAGAVGGLLATRLEALGSEVLCCDPPLALQSDSQRDYSPLEDVLACDVVSLHVPLTKLGRHASQHLISSRELKLLRCSILINACRGSVVNEAALKQFLEDRPELLTVFDVWENEPNIDLELVAKAGIATPHIAGYSSEAKLNATEILARELQAYFNLPASEAVSPAMSQELLLGDFIPGEQLHWETLLHLLPLAELSDSFRVELGQGEPEEVFDKYRQKLRGRHEAKARALEKKRYSESQQVFLGALGFRFV